MNVNVDKIVPRKLSIALATLYMLERAQAPPWCYIVVGGIAMVSQLVLDYKKDVQKETPKPD